MPENYNYEELPTLCEISDIAEYIDTAWSKDHAESSHSLAMLSLTTEGLESQVCVDTASDRNDTVQESSASASDSPAKKQFASRMGARALLNVRHAWQQVISRIRRKPLPPIAPELLNQHPAAEIEPARIKQGVWKDQLLVDRTLRSMSLLMAAFALVMILVVCINAKEYGNRLNKTTSSVGGRRESCKAITRRNTALLFVINVAATMILGMSNTYQQLITSLETSDLAHMLRNYGDSRVGTNSPWNINKKVKGKKRAWAAWLLLVFTSLPIHFLANSLIGPSYVIEPPSVSDIKYVPKPPSEIEYVPNPNYYIGYNLTFLCLSAFLTGRASYANLEPAEFSVFSHYGLVDNEIEVVYPENCTNLKGTWNDIDSLVAAYRNPTGSAMNFSNNEILQCISGLSCSNQMEPVDCRLNVRMNAAFVLAAALIIKAVYMVTVNIVARGQMKRNLLTFGDVIVASATHSELRVHGECMVNARENYRRHITHTCHKHCKSPEASKTGEELGHCQKCKKWNTCNNKFTNELQPTIATKIKRSLISNLGNTALTQMALMIFCSVVMFLASIVTIVIFVPAFQQEIQECKSHVSDYDSDIKICNTPKAERFAELSGGWGGFNRSLPLDFLSVDSASNEIITVIISNGAQFIYSLLYLLLIYNITLVNQEYNWGKLERERIRLRCTTVVGESFSQNYLLQLPKKILFPLMAYSMITHWMLGEALQTQETILQEDHREKSMYTITYAVYPLWASTILILTMTGICWWAFTYRREGVIPQMFGSIRVLCAATTQLDDFPVSGIKWGDLGMGEQFRHAGISAEEVGTIQPYELYAGTGSERKEEDTDEERGG